MPNYISKVVERFQHPIPKLPKYSLHKWFAPTYGAKVQYSPDATTAPKLVKSGITTVQSIASTFLYISRTNNPTMIFAFNKIGSKQALPTINTIKKTKILMDFAATQPDAVVSVYSSDMCLHIHSDSTYLVHTKARSRASGHYYLSDITPLPPIRC